MNRETILLNWNAQWRNAIASYAETQMGEADPGHDREHLQRVVQNVLALSDGTQAELRVLLPAAWLHDCVSVPKNSPLRSQASRLAAESARQFLESIEYPNEYWDAIAHCIEAHSFSAGIPCRTLEAQLVQDADRLEALGAIGLARCLMTGGSLRQRLYDPEEPFPTTRAAVDTKQSVDHFFSKLLRLSGTMQTESGRREAARRTRFLVDFLRELARELGGREKDLERALENALAEAVDLV